MVAFPGSARGGSPLTPCQLLPAFTVEEQRQRLLWARGGRVRPDMGCAGPLHTMEGWGSMALYGICPAPLPPRQWKGGAVWPLWWVDPGWLPGAHPAALSLPSSAGQGGEKMR